MRQTRAPLNGVLAVPMETLEYKLFTSDSVLHRGAVRRGREGNQHIQSLRSFGRGFDCHRHPRGKSSAKSVVDWCPRNIAAYRTAPVLGSSGRGEKLSIIGNNRQQLNPSIEAGVCVYGSEKGTTGNLAQPLRVRVGPHFQAALSACHEDYALNADLTLERVEFGAAITFGAFSSSNSRTTASTSSCKRTKLSARGDRLRCASRIIPK